MSENIILKKSPKIEFQLLENGFNLIDTQTERNSGYYSYNDLQAVELNNAWFPRLAKWLRIITWVLNGVPYFPDAESYKKANLIFRFRKTRLGIWLTDPSMADEAKKLEKLLEEKALKSN
jgi:hypothetical protein